MKKLVTLFKEETLLCTLAIIVALVGITVIVMIIVFAPEEKINTNGITTLTTTTNAMNTLTMIHTIIH